MLSVVLLVTAAVGIVNAQTRPTLLVDVDHRATLSLNGDWHVIVDPYASGMYDFHQKVKKDGYFMNSQSEQNGRPIEYNFGKSPILRVPGDWNTQRDDLFYYEGIVWYQRNFSYSPIPGKRTLLHFGAANYRASVWVNTRFVCEHEGGFTPFDCEITDVAKPGDNFVVLAVDNARAADNVPTLQTDWWNYGGLTRDVSLVEVPTEFIDDFDIHLSRTNHRLIEGYVHVEGARFGTKVSVQIPELKAVVTSTLNENGRAAIRLTIDNLTLWTPEVPKLYRVSISSGADQLEDEIGFRTIETRGSQILLNGQPIFLRGISIHAEAPYRTGRAYSQKDADTLLGWAKELGCNYVRLAHYPHDEKMTRTTDRLGLLVWSEIPDYWALQFDNPHVLEKSKQQLTEMIRRDRGKASVILWSVANETPNTRVRTGYLTALADLTRQLDATRLVSAALLVRTEASQSGSVKILDDPLVEALDVLGANEYIGWYEQTPSGADTTTWEVRYDKPLIMSEWGGDALAGFHGNPTDRWTEEYQADLYRHQISMLNRIPQLRGTTPWILMDFRSPRRVLPGIQDNFNRKGVVSDQGQKKQAFYILQDAYVHRTFGKAE